MKVYVEIVDTKSGIFQCGMIDEPIQKGFEILNAINHFIAVRESELEWEYEIPSAKFGRVVDTTKVISVITV